VSTTPADTDGQLARRLGLFDAVVIGLGSMIGAGIFAALAPAAKAAGSGLLLALAIAAVVAYCNATSSARLATRYPASGGTYVYGRERLGPFWGYLAGWGFVIGKTASCAAMALTVGLYAWPQHAHAIAVAAVVALTAVNYVGIQKSAWLTRAIVATVLAVLAAVVITSLSSASAQPAHLSISGNATPAGVLQAAGLLFFAFAGYARIATLGEEVRDPARTIPRAVPIALGLTLAVYTIVAVAVLTVLGDRLAGAAAPLADAVRAAGWPQLSPLVRVGATVAALGSLLAAILGVSLVTRLASYASAIAAPPTMKRSATTPRRKRRSPSAAKARSRVRLGREVRRQSCSVQVTYGQVDAMLTESGGRPDERLHPLRRQRGRKPRRRQHPRPGPIRWRSVELRGEVFRERAEQDIPPRVARRGWLLDQ
jgi:APA family basic amino acid/polyamine antiporter